jgi:hypothetical protein
MRKFSLFILVLIVLFTSCRKKDEFGTRIVVPDDVPSIIKAIQVADPYDTIIIRPGEYFEHDINISKPVYITSEYKTLADTAIIRKTIINGNQESRVFLISNITDTVRMNGFTIKGGLIGKKDEVSIENDYGGGIFLDKSKLKISNVRISDNLAFKPNQNGACGALYINESFISINNCSIYNNRAIRNGGAFWCTGSTLLINDSNISYNHSDRDNAIAISNSVLNFKNVLMQDNSGPVISTIYSCSGIFENVIVTGNSINFTDNQIIFTDCTIPGL